MLIYSVIGDGTKIHMINNYLLAQLVQKDLKEDGFKNTGIKEHDIDIVHLALSWGIENIPIYISFTAGNFKFKLKKDQWEYFRDSIKQWDKRQKSKGRPYYKLYGTHHIICLTESQRHQLTWDMVRKGGEYNYNVDDMSNGY